MAGFDDARARAAIVGTGRWIAASDAESLVHDAAALSAGRSTFLADIFGTGLLTLEGMAPLVAARRRAGRPLPFCTDSPGALFRAGGWRNAVVVQAGQPAANFGRLTRTLEAKDAGQQSNLRTHLVTAAL